MSRFIIVGFDSGAEADRFTAYMQKTDRVLKLAEAYTEEGKTKHRLHTIRARACHEFFPKEHEKRRFDLDGVVIEFRKSSVADDFVRTVVHIMTGDITDDDIETLAKSLEDDNVAGIRFERR